MRHETVNRFDFDRDRLDSCNGQVMNGINIIPQYSHHSNAWIIGTTKDLTLLRDAITSALNGNETGRSIEGIETCASDGECYDLAIEVLSEDAFKSKQPFYTSMVRADGGGYLT